MMFNIIGTIPSCIGQMTKLTGLQWYSNKLTGSIPTSIGQLTNLLVLILSTNSLTGNGGHLAYLFISRYYSFFYWIIN